MKEKWHDDLVGRQGSVCINFTERGTSLLIAQLVKH